LVFKGNPRESPVTSMDARGNDKAGTVNSGGVEAIV
jgi:hypothetical protein